MKMPEVEKNPKGQLLLDPQQLARQAVGSNFSRYNGGWIKHVIGLDKTKTNGFSLLGRFLNAGLQWLDPGLYLDCSVAGSRNRPEKRYTLFRLLETGDIEVLNRQGDFKDWAVRLWPAIEEALKKIYTSPSDSWCKEELNPWLAEVSDDELIRELYRRGYEVARRQAAKNI
jgi:hypothetical protein